MRDVLNNMKKKTWDYGTVKTVRIEGTYATDVGKAVLAIEETDKEGFVMLGLDQQYAEMWPEGELIDIIFMKGGPLGGHWLPLELYNTQGLQHNI